MAKKKKLTTEQIMEAIIDKDMLEERKNAASSKSKTTVVIETKVDDSVEKEPLKWFELPIQKSDFKTKTIDKQHYAQHKEWNKRVWIGPYDSKKELDKVILLYVDEMKKNVLERNLYNVHSVIIED